LLIKLKKEGIPMKKILALLVTLVLLVGLTVSASADYGRSYIAPMGTPTIDGEIDEIWEKAEWTAVDKAHDGDPSSTSTLKIKLLWDYDQLYFLAEVFDETYSEAEDIVEIYLDQNNDKLGSYSSNDFQTRFRLSGTVVDGDASGTNAQLDALFKVKNLGDGKYLLEGGLAWPEEVTEGDKSGLEFMYNDADESDLFIEAYRWNVDTNSGDQPPFQSTSDFGLLTLGNENGSVPEESTPESSTPESSTPESSTPESSTPESSTPEASTPEPSAPEESTSTPESSSSQNSQGGDNGGNGSPIIWIVIAAVVVVAIVVVVILGKKKK